MNTIKFYEGNHGECNLEKGNKVHEELEGLIDEWRKQMSTINWIEHDREQLIELYGVPKRRLNSYFDTEKLHERKQQINTSMTTLYKTDNEHLRKAFIEELKELGYTPFGVDSLCLFVYTKENQVGSCVVGSKRSKEATQTFDLKTQWNEALQHATEQLQPKYKVSDWVITEGYNDEYDGTPLKISHIFHSDMNHGETYCEFEQGNGNFNIKSIKRLATKEEIEQATRKTFFDWEVTKSKNTTKIGCQTFDNDFLQELTEAIFNLEGDITITELLDELYEIGFQSERDELPF